MPKIPDHCKDGHNRQPESAELAGQQPPPATAKPDLRLAFWAHQGPRPAFDKPNQAEPPIDKPDLRLALMPNQGGASDNNAKGLAPPSVRLVAANDSGNTGAGVIASGLIDPARVEPAPNVRLAHGPGAQGDNVLIGQRGVAAMPDDRLPGLLVSYYYLPQFLENRHRYHYRDWVMDSGAFSAHNSGVEIKLSEYIACCRKLMVEDPTLVEIYSLDVIGDWKASLDNTERMWAEGVPAIPCFHVGEPWSALMDMAKRYPKIALGGVAQIGSKKAIAWASQCFARIWPKKVHGFAMCNESAVMALPLHSVDSTSWEIAPCKYGQWKAFGNQRVSVRGSKQNLRAEVEWYLELERRARQKWKKQMALLEEVSPTVRLALAGLSANGSPATYYKPGGLMDKALEAPAPIVAPSLRLADSGEGGRVESKADAFSRPPGV